MASKSVAPKVEQNQFPAESSYVCRTCGNVVEKNFCSLCGEKKLNKHDFSFGHFVEETFEGFTHFDNKFFRTAYLLLFKPGQLSVDFFEGRRIPYMRPFQMFIVCNILFFLFVGKSNVFSQPLSSYYLYSPYIHFGTRELIHSLAKTESQQMILAAKFNEMMASNSKAFLAAFIPFIAMGSMIVNFRKRIYLTEHLVFGTHFFTFIVIFYTFFLLIIAQPFQRWNNYQFSSTFDLSSSLVCLFIFSTYFTIAARRFYGISITRATIGAIITAIIFLATLMSYRMALFYKVIYSVT